MVHWSTLLLLENEQTYTKVFHLPVEFSLFVPSLQETQQNVKWSLTLPKYNCQNTQFPAIFPWLNLYNTGMSLEALQRSSELLYLALTLTLNPVSGTLHMGMTCLYRGIQRAWFIPKWKSSPSDLLSVHEKTQQAQSEGSLVSDWEARAQICSSTEKVKI